MKDTWSLKSLELLAEPPDRYYQYFRFRVVDCDVVFDISTCFGNWMVMKFLQQQVIKIGIH